MSDELLVTQDGPVAIVTLNRPHVHNALNRRVLEQLSATFSSLVANDAVRAIVLTGAGEKAFSAGADLDELEGLSRFEAVSTLSYGQSVMLAISQSPVPVIAAVNGLALGGGFELALSSTFTIASTAASFGLPEAGLGLIPGYGGTQRLPRVVGPAVAAHLMLTGNRLTAARAYQLGLTPLEPPEPAVLMPEAMALAQQVASRGPSASAAILEALRTRAPLANELYLETSLAAAATVSLEAVEGIAAFKARRRPDFPARAAGSRSSA